MPLQNIDHPAVHRPMSLLLQALKQIEQKTPIVTAEPPRDSRSSLSPPAAESAAITNPVRQTAAPDRNMPPGDTIELIRQYEASETASEIALAGPVHIAAVPILATPPQSDSRSMTYDDRRRRRFADEFLKLVPHDRAVIAMAPAEGLDAWPVIRELCRGLVAQGDGDVLAVVREPNDASREPENTVRLSDMLGGREGWQSAVRRDAAEGFFVLKRGDDEAIAASNGRSLLKLWQALSEQFAYVIVDVGQTNPAAATSLLASCDGTFAVVRLDRTNRREVERLIVRIRTVGGRVCGCLVVD